MHKMAHVKYIAVVLLLFSIDANATRLVASNNYELSHILGTMRVLYENKTFPFIRIVESAESISECGGTYQSCPNFRLFIVVSMGDLHDPPSLYELPVSKGWELESVIENSNESLIVLVTTLEQPKVNTESLGEWGSKTYKILVTNQGAVHEVK